MATQAVDLVKDIRGLITLPDVYLRITRLVEDPRSTRDDIAKAVNQDPSFAARLLRVANSPMYGRSAQIDTVDRAVTIIGTSQIRTLALSMSVAKSFEGLPNELVSMENFWRHSLLCALAARFIAKQAGKCDPEVLFTAGLLHDIGELVIFNRLPDKAALALTKVLDTAEEQPIHVAERQVMGFDHGDVGGELAREWNLPALLVECIAYHHDIDKPKAYPRETALVHLANTIALMAEIDTLDPGDVPPLDSRAWEKTGLDDSIREPAIRFAQAEIRAVEKLFVGNA